MLVWSRSFPADCASVERAWGGGIASYVNRRRLIRRSADDPDSPARNGGEVAIDLTELLAKCQYDWQIVTA